MKLIGTEKNVTKEGKENGEAKHQLLIIKYK